MRSVNTFHATSVSRRQIKNVTKNSKNSKILEFGDYIGNQHEKFIQISTNMPGIGLENCEISRIFFRGKKLFCMDGETNSRVEVLTLTTLQASADDRSNI